MKARLWHLFASVLGFAGFIGSAHAQEEAVRTIPFEGPEVFAHVLHSEKIKPIATFDEAYSNPEQSVIILFGNPSFIERQQNAGKGLITYRNRGGNVLVATDYQVYLLELNVRIAGTPISQRVDPYRRTPDCPWIALEKDKGLANAEAAEHPLLQSLQRGIATNRPTRVLSAPIIRVQKAHGPTSMQSLLVIPDAVNAATQTKFVGPWPEYMFASRKDGPSYGRALVIGGHGMFMNGMMLQDDNDNFAFSRNAVRWLCEGSDGKPPRHVLFIYEGRVIPDFDMNLSPPPPPIPVPTVQMLNRLVKGLEEERFFHRVLEEMLGPQLLRNVVLVLVGIITLCLILYGAKKLRAARAQVDTAVPSLLGTTSPSGPLDLLKERQQALLRQDDFWAEAHDLVRAWFHNEFDVTPELWRTDVQAGFQADGSLLTRWRLQRKADFALRLARAAAPLRVSRHEFFALIDSLKEMSLARQTGRLALLVEGKNVRQV